MFNIKKTARSIFGLVGFEQPKNNDIPSLEAPLLVTRSGKLFNKGVHELVNLENIFLSGPDFSKYNTTTGIGVLFNQHLTSMAETAITNVLHAVVSKKKIYALTKDTLTQTQLFSSPGRMADKIIKGGRFVGLMIETKQGRTGVIPVIRKIMLQATDMNPSLKFYIYHPDQTAPLLEVNAGAWRSNNLFNSISVNQLENTLLDTDFNSYERLIVGYYEDDLTGQAISREQDISKAPCGSCNAANTSMYWQWANNLSVHPFEVASEDIDSVGKTLFASNAMQYRYNTNYGLNLEIAVNCDLSEFIIQNQSSLVEPIALQFAVQVLEQIQHSTRENNISDKLKAGAYQALDGGEKEPGMYKKLDQAIENLSFDFSGFRSPCLPCNTKSGISIKSVF